MPYQPTASDYEPVTPLRRARPVEEDEGARERPAPEDAAPTDYFETARTKEPDDEGVQSNDGSVQSDGGGTRRASALSVATKGRAFEPVDGRENPEQSLLRRESENEAANYVDDFLKGLHAAVRGKSKQYDRMLGVLWYCYLSPAHITQLEAAARLNVSDSLVSDYRRRIEQQLRALNFTEIEEARRFEVALRERVRALVLIGDEESVPV